ncbi:MAG: AAA family ATPase [Bacteroidaceae bacterium]|nr:AAA family ATPase [Bacteroidaceae bacterium]
MSARVQLDFQKMIDVNTPIIYIHAYDFVRVDDVINKVVGSSRIIEWNPITGRTNFSTKEPQGEELLPLDAFLRDIYLDEFFTNDRYIVLRDIQDIIDTTEIKTVLQLMALRRLYDPTYNTTVIIVSSVQKVPTELKQFVSFLDMGYPDEDEINSLIDEHVEVNGYDSFNDDDRQKLMPSLKGLTAFEIDRMLDMAMSSNGTLSAEDREMINRHKKQMVKNSGVLELIDTPESLDSIGGLDTLKNYLKIKAKVLQHLPEAQNAHVTVPKGVFIIGMPGCGKSLCAKASAALFDTPLLKMDMGSMMGKYVGESEANLRHAIKIAEAAAPCVLWIDEIEKAFSGVGGNNDIMTRMFGYFLSWMQDKTSSVYVIATANNADNLPPELKRKGRFDEIFCVNLPNEKEREAIFKVHLGKRGHKDLKIDNVLLKATDGFNGADIESVVNEAVEDVFVKNLDGKNDTLTSSVLLDKAKNTISISKSCKKQIDNMKKAFAESNFKDASKV